MIDAAFREHGSTADMAESVAGELQAIVEKGRERQGEILLALPGGGTPMPVYAKLKADGAYWSGVTVVPGDDRLVPAGSDLCNVSKIAAAVDGTGAKVLPLAAPQDDYRAAGREADALLHTLPWPPECVWLGMGGDGHTASIFVGPDLEAALDAPDEQRAIGVLPDPLPPEAPVARVTLTRSAILSARQILVTISGEAKKALLRQALSEGGQSRFPIGRVLAGAKQPIWVHWCP